jgi:hypothetical protein
MRQDGATTHTAQNTEVAKTGFWRANGLTQFAFNWILCSPDLTPTDFFLSAYVKKSCEAENGDH